MSVHSYSCSTIPKPPVIPEIPPAGPEDIPGISDPVVFPEPVNDPDINLPEIPIIDPGHVPEQPEQFMSNA